MYICRYCKNSMQNQVDGCGRCLSFKREVLTESFVDNSPMDELKALARSLRREREIMDSTRTEEFDPKRVAAISKLTEAHNSLMKGLRALAKENTDVLERMTVEDRLKAYAQALCRLPEADRVLILNLSRLAAIGKLDNFTIPSETKKKPKLRLSNKKDFENQGEN